MINKKHLLRFEELKLIEKQVVKELDELKPLILQEMIDQGVDETPPLNVGKIILVNKKKWTFSPVVDALVATADAQKAKEKADGTAKSEPAPYIQYEQ